MRATTRTLTRLVGAHLGIDSVPYAARLVRTGDMLRSNEEADEFDAAALLAAILAAPVPEMAVDALDTLGESTLGPATWTPTGILAALQPAGVEVLRESDRLLLPVSPVDLLVELILMPQGDIRLAGLWSRSAAGPPRSSCSMATAFSAVGVCGRATSTRTPTGGPA